MDCIAVAPFVYRVTAPTRHSLEKGTRIILAQGVPMLEEFNEQEGPDLERLCQGVSPSDEPCGYPGRCIALLAKGGSATHTLRTRIGIRVCVNRVRKAARLDHQSFAKSLSSGPEPQASRDCNRRRNPGSEKVAHDSPEQPSGPAAVATRRPFTNVLRRSLHPMLESLEVPKAGFHSFRRFRATHLSKSRVPESLVKFWMGHAESNQTEEYVKLFDEVVYRREVADSIGLGFEIMPEKPIVRNVRKKSVKLEVAISV